MSIDPRLLKSFLLPSLAFLPPSDPPSPALRQHLRAAARSLSRRLMDTEDMRCQFKEWRKTTFSSPASSFPSGEGEEEEGKEEALTLGGVEAVVAAAAIEEGVKVSFYLFSLHFCPF